MYLPSQSGSSEPARDSEYLLPRKKKKKRITLKSVYNLMAFGSS